MIEDELIEKFIELFFKGLFWIRSSSPSRMAGFYSSLSREAPAVSVIADFVYSGLLLVRCTICVLQKDILFLWNEILCFGSDIKVVRLCSMPYFLNKSLPTFKKLSFYVRVRFVYLRGCVPPFFKRVGAFAVLRAWVPVKGAPVVFSPIQRRTVRVQPPRVLEKPDGGFDTTGLFVEETERVFFHTRQVSFEEAWFAIRYLSGAKGRYKILRAIREDPEMSRLFRAHAEYFTRSLPNPALQRFLPALRGVREAAVPVPSTVLLDLLARWSAVHGSLKPVAPMLGWSGGVPSYLFKPNPEDLWQLRCLEFDIRIVDQFLETNRRLFTRLGRSLQWQRTYITKRTELYAFVDQYPITGPSVADLVFFPPHDGIHGLSWWPFIPTGCFYISVLWLVAILTLLCSLVFVTSNSLFNLRQFVALLSVGVFFALFVLSVLFVVLLSVTDSTTTWVHWPTTMPSLCKPDLFFDNLTAHCIRHFNVWGGVVYCLFFLFFVVLFFETIKAHPWLVTAAVKVCAIKFRQPGLALVRFLSVGRRTIWKKSVLIFAAVSRSFRG